MEPTRNQYVLDLIASDEAYDEGWSYAEEHPQAEYINDNPLEGDLSKSWEKGFSDCIFGMMS